ncbi:hypothetical protein F441_17881 [Phytophthora nicotianae CJ01A1]|uniref:Uncharacterized protein n=2 Tax=Phytophthora nicotianae TaxID=4792 RepID=W2G1A4_PHYNI|nr:hypothetical protein L915_17530 [Phytophthora nicotianae]ETL29380.1 hypothetical protein L916_17422 [Phytophthora nicotianae]ETM35844.1 hypothetical protein L914_17324 [Phytophthora nicotianae]ETP05517.1 hypothetical protein F441_17881 [Phytophthora nicotianae CJ01A1]
MIGVVRSRLHLKSNDTLAELLLGKHILGSSDGFM